MAAVSTTRLVGIAAAAGGGGAWLANNGSTVYGVMRDGLLLWRGPGGGAGDGDLRREMNLLREEVAKAMREGRTTVIHAGGSSGGRGLLLTLLPAGGVAVLSAYMAGWRWSDLAYVTRKGFRAGIATVLTGVDVVHQRLKRTHEELSGALAAVSAKVDDSAEIVRETRVMLGDLVADVADAQATLAGLERGVGSLERGQAAAARSQAALAAKVDAVRGEQAFATRGIGLLCGVTGDAIAGAPARPDVADDLRHFAAGANAAPEPPALAPMPAAAVVPARAVAPPAPAAARGEGLMRLIPPVMASVYGRTPGGGLGLVAPPPAPPPSGPPPAAPALPWGLAASYSAAS